MRRVSFCDTIYYVITVRAIFDLDFTFYEYPSYIEIFRLYSSGTIISMYGPYTAALVGLLVQIFITDIECARLPDPPVFAAVQHYPSICYLPPGTVIELTLSVWMSIR